MYHCIRLSVYVRLSVYHWAGMRWVTRPGEGVSQRPTGIFHAIRNLQVATRCLGVFTDSLHPIPHAGAARGGHRNERQPTATISDIRPPPQAPFSGTMFIYLKKFFILSLILRVLLLANNVFQNFIIKKTRAKTIKKCCKNQEIFKNFEISYKSACFDNFRLSIR